MLYPKLSLQRNNAIPLKLSLQINNAVPPKCHYKETMLYHQTVCKETMLYYQIVTAKNAVPSDYLYKGVEQHSLSKYKRHYTTDSITYICQH